MRFLKEYGYFERQKVLQFTKNFNINMELRDVFYYYYNFTHPGAFLPNDMLFLILDKIWLKFYSDLDGFNLDGLKLYNGLTNTFNNTFKKFMNTKKNKFKFTEINEETTKEYLEQILKYIKNES